MDTGELEALLAAAEPLIQLAIDEDIGPGDATGESTLNADITLQGRVVAKAPGVIAGLPVAERVFQRIDPEIRFVSHIQDGQPVVAGELIADVTGSARSLLAAERTVLNFVQRLSGIATITKEYVDAIATTGAILLDTRKTLPGYRVLDKYAVRMGGGDNHRFSLYDMLLIKDNHIDGAGSISTAAAQARKCYPQLPIEIEVRDLDELRECLSLSPPLDRILLDNMNLQTMREAVALAAGRVPLEASGNVTLERAAEIGATGVTFISVGALTHSVQALDLSMKVASPESGESANDLAQRAHSLKAILGGRLTLLGHHYQRDEVLELVDFRGDSLKLAQDAARADTEFIVFCGVRFMAEVAAILAKPGQRVFMPEPAAGCYLADTANIDAVQNAWDALGATLGCEADTAFTPITTINSSADLKAFCGTHGGVVCTSGNAPQVLQWALARKPGVFFFPDQHLGRTTAHRLGIPLDDMILWDTRYPLESAKLRQAKIVLWPGVCNVHHRFRAQHVHSIRVKHPDIRVCVHPECSIDVVNLADAVGSTAQIIQQVQTAPAGSQWAIGTENRLVIRLRQQHPEQRILSLADVAPYCSTMGQTTLRNLTDQLDALVNDEPLNEITVDPSTAARARIALERMLDLDSAS